MLKETNQKIYYLLFFIKLIKNILFQFLKKFFNVYK